MKSTLKQFVPMEQIEIPAWMRTTAPTAEEREAELAALREAEETLLRGHIRLDPVEKAGADSVVRLSLRSALPRYNRESVPVTLGLGLYSGELEAAIPGRTVGEVFEAKVGGQPVAVRLLSAENRVLPTDPREIAFDPEADGAADYDAWVALQRDQAHDQRAKDRVRTLCQHITLKMNELCQPQFEEEEFSLRRQSNLDLFIQQYCDIFGSSREQLDDSILNMCGEQAEGATQWEMGDALIGIAMGLEPSGQGDEIQQYAAAFRAALLEYCKSIVKEERE